MATSTAVLCAAVALALASVPSVAALNTKLAAGDELCFHEDLAAGETMSGSFEVLRGGFFDVDVRVVAPGGGDLYSVERERSGNFNVEAPVAGAYKWCFRNQAKTKTQKTIAFNLHVGDSSATAELANIDHVTPLQREVAQLRDAVTGVADEQQYMRFREIVHRDTTESTNSRVLWWTFAEAAVLVVMSAWQVWTILGQFETRGRV